VIDVRDGDAVLGRLRQAERAFERGAPVPSAARELLDELADVLADSGPLELGVTAWLWLSGVESAREGSEAGHDAEQSRKAVRLAKKSIRELKPLFGGHCLTWYDWLWLPWVVLVALPTLICVLPVLPLVLLIGLVKKRYLPSVRQVASALELEDRALFAHPVSASAVNSARRTRLRAFVHPVLVATKTHLLLADPFSELPVRPDQQHFSIAWELPYARIQSFSSRTLRTGETELVTVTAPRYDLAYKLPAQEGRALIAILKRRAPEAFDAPSLHKRTPELAVIPAAPRHPSVAVGAACSDEVTRAVRRSSD
jgi:hypothetical protein